MAEPTPPGKQTFVGFQTDQAAYRNASRIQYKTDDGYTYTSWAGRTGTSQTGGNSDPLQEYSASEKKAIAKRSGKALHVNPYKEHDKKVIPHTQEEINDFQRALQEKLPSLIESGRPYVKKKVGNSIEDEMTNSDAKDPGIDLMQIKFLKDLPLDAWDDPLCYFQGGVRKMLQQHVYVTELRNHIEPLMSPVDCYKQDSSRTEMLFNRREYKLDEINRRAERGGTTRVQRSDVATNAENKTELSCWGYRFVRVDEKTDKEDMENNRTKKEDVSKLTLETFTSYLDDRLRLVIVVHPSKNRSGWGRVVTFFFTL
jgi:hypothetical protein